MRNHSLVGALVVAGLTTGCDNARQRAPGPSPNPQPVVVSVEISGPDSIRPGQSAQFTAIARLSDGTRLTAVNARWFSNTAIIRVDASGLATAEQLIGEAHSPRS